MRIGRDSREQYSTHVTPLERGHRGERRVGWTVTLARHVSSRAIIRGTHPQRLLRPTLGTPCHEIPHDANGPKPIDEDEPEDYGGSIHLCMCGPSNDYPYCDGSHTAATDEEADTRYEYENDDDENPRHVTAEMVFDDD